MIVQHIRHATSVIEYNGKRILIDPMFSAQGQLPATAGTPNQRPNPLVDLPVPLPELLNVDAIVITHTHRDHLDDAAVEALAKHLPLLCQPADSEKLAELGFTDITAVAEQTEWLGINVHRIGGHHGTGEIGEKMGPVSGFVFAASGEPSLYVAGDTIWCAEVGAAIEAHDPDVIVLYAGAAQFLKGDPITMSTEDIKQVAVHAPQSKIVVEHMEAWNHCLLTRKELQEFLQQQGLSNQVWVPQDGQSVQIGQFD